MGSVGIGSAVEIGVVMQVLEFESGVSRECFTLSELAELTRSAGSDGTYMVWLHGGEWFFEPISWGTGYTVGVHNYDVLYANAEHVPSVKFFEDRLSRCASDIWYESKLRFLGIWHENDGQGGADFYLDSVINIFEKDKALTVASVLDEKAVWDNKEGVSVYV